MRAILFSLAVLTAGLSTGAIAQDQGGAVLIRGARVFDREKIVGVRDVLVHDGRIAKVGARIAPPPGVDTVDGAGKTLLPGLIDSHVHVFPSAAADALRFGVTTEFDMFTLAPPDLVQARRTQRASYARTEEADVWSAGNGVTPPGGHPTQMVKAMGATIPTLDDSTDPKAFVAARVAEGSDYIKIFQDDGTAHGGAVSLTAFAPDRLKAAIAAAHEADRKAIVHVSKLRDAKQAYGFGADAIAHMFQDAPADDELIGILKGRDVAVIATLSVLAGASGDDAPTRLVADPAIAPALSPMQKGMIAAKFPKQRPAVLGHALESIRRLDAAGITILAGTDAPNPSTAHGPTLHEELELLVRGGMKPAAALAAATSRPAAFFGATDRGRIAAGLRADLLLVEGDPTVDITATRRIAEIWKNGYPVDRAKLPTPPQPPGR